MSTQPFSENDDDLFNYDPSQDNRPKYEPVVTPSTSGSQNKVLDDLYRGIENITNDITNKDASFRVGVADALYEAYQEYLLGSLPLAHLSSVLQTLDELTDYRFGALQTCRYIEQNIFRRLNIHALIQAILENNARDEEGYTFKEFLQKANIDIPDDFVTVYFSTLFRISNHVLNVERAQYMDLCAKLEITPNPLAIDPTALPRDIVAALPLNAQDIYAPYINSVLSNTFDEQRVSSIQSIFSSDVTPKNTSI